MRRELTTDERAAIAALERLAKRWPRSLKLFSNSGSLLVIPNDGRDMPWPLSYELARIAIPNDGGDADWETAEEERAQ